LLISRRILRILLKNREQTVENCETHVEDDTKWSEHVCEKMNQLNHGFIVSKNKPSPDKLKEKSFSNSDREEEKKVEENTLQNRKLKERRVHEQEESEVGKHFREERGKKFEGRGKKFEGRGKKFEES